MVVKRVAVIGAGVSGLCVLRLLAAEPDLFQVVAFERAAKVGGQWAYTDQVGVDEDGLPVHSSIYKDMRMNTPKCITSFEGFPYKRQQPSYVGHEEVLEYLASFADHYNLNQFIKFKTLVTKVDPLSPGSRDTRWEVTYRSTLDQSQTETAEFDYVIVCNGHLSVPFIPEVPGICEFSGTVIHAHEYRISEKFKGQKVVIVGGGPTSIDLAVELLGVAKRITISSAEGSYLTYVAPDAVLRKPGIDHVTPSSVVFTSGEEEPADVIILCTGYTYSFPFLSDACHVVLEDEGRRVTPLFKHTFHTENTSFIFIGIVEYVSSFCMYEHMAKFVFNVLSGKAKLPSQAEMEADTAECLEKWIASGMARRNFHKMGVSIFELADSISKVGQVPPIPEGIRKVYFEAFMQFCSNFQRYRDTNFEIVGDSFRIL